MNPNDDLKFRQDLRRIAQGAGKQIENSSVFLSLFTRNYVDDAKAVLEMGIAILLDKPIYLMVPEGLVIPKNVERLALGIERFELDNKKSLEDASVRLMAKAKKDLNL